MPEESLSPSARTLERVVSVAQNLGSEEVMVAIASLELYGQGLGVLRWRISFEEPPTRYGLDSGIPEPWFEIRDEEGRLLSWSPQGAGSSGEEADGEALIEGLPETGKLRGLGNASCHRRVRRRRIHRDRDALRRTMEF